MANQSIQVKIDRFEILVKKPNSWVMILQKNNYLNVGDWLTVNEVDSNNVPTGRVKLGKVRFKGSILDRLLDNNLEYYYFYKTI